jgi:uncharacterized delta-60 repeat protein
MLQMPYPLTPLLAVMVRFVVVGTSDNGSGTSEFAVARFNVDGSLDTSFSTDGLVTTSFSAGNDVGSGIAVQSDGKIVVVGTSDNGSGTSPVSTSMVALTPLLALMVW